jgi:hypothetical protein
MLLAAQGNLTGVATQTEPTAFTAFRITVVVDPTKEKGTGESDVRYTHSGSKDAQGTPETEQRFLPDFSDAV